MKLYIVQTYEYNTYSYDGTREGERFIYLDETKAKQRAVELAALRDGFLGHKVYDSVCIDECNTED